MTDGSIYDEDYFLRGKESGKSLYSDYRWMPALTIPMVEAMIDHLGIKKGQTILDFGCARGYTVKAFRMLGYRAWGVDISEWAVANADEEVRAYLWTTVGGGPSMGKFDWVIAKDVLEHVPYVQRAIDGLMECASVGVFAVVPLSTFYNTPYVIEDYERDVTHIQRRSLLGWVEMFLEQGWSVEAAYRVVGVKDNYKQYATGNGFITARRVEG
jgi:hypothetical protein